MKPHVWIGYDPRFDDAWRVAYHSLRNNSRKSLRTCGMVKLEDARTAGIYTRPTEMREGVLWDVISAAPMSTEFACSRFLTPELARRAGQTTGFVMFVDCDILCRDNVGQLFKTFDPAFALYCVKHQHEPVNGQVKMDKQLQTTYARKNWSSVMAFNLDHPANAGLTVEHVNAVPGRDLHRFDWLDEHGGEALIGELPARWNYLVGHTVLPDDTEPAIVHFTDGIPSIPGYENVEFADEWRALELATRGSDGAATDIGTRRVNPVGRPKGASPRQP
jgi:hypothetical protein